MAIRDIVSRGYGNGTYSPGVNKIPVRGYTIGSAAAPMVACIRAVDAYTAGIVRGDVYTAGVSSRSGAGLSEVYTAGAKKGQACE